MEYIKSVEWINTDLDEMEFSCSVLIEYKRFPLQTVRLTHYTYFND